MILKNKLLLASNPTYTLMVALASFLFIAFRAKRGSACLAIRKYHLFSFQYRRTAP